MRRVRSRPSTSFFYRPYVVWCRAHGALDLQTLEQTYHDMANLRLVHNNCNASKGTRDLFDWLDRVSTWHRAVNTHDSGGGSVFLTF